MGRIAFKKGDFMASTVLYLKLERNVKLDKPDVRISDLGKLVCADTKLLARIKAMKIYDFDKKDISRCVISVMKLIEAVQKFCPELTVDSLGAAEVIVEYKKKTGENGVVTWLKVAFVSLICFFGPAFTIMAFHNDIGISAVFGKFYEMIAGEASDGYTILELSYSIGLALGIILFFNHVGGRRITKDPTPIEVEMRIYEDDVNNALVETADREGEMIDVS